MSVERELGALTTEVAALKNAQDATNAKLDTLMAGHAVLMETHTRNRNLAHGSMLTAIGAVITAVFSLLRGFHG